MSFSWIRKYYLEWQQLTEAQKNKQRTYFSGSPLQDTPYALFEKKREVNPNQ